MKMKSKVLNSVLALSLVVGMSPMAAFATEGVASEDDQQGSEQPKVEQPVVEQTQPEAPQTEQPTTEGTATEDAEKQADSQDIEGEDGTQQAETQGTEVLPVQPNEEGMNTGEVVQQPEPAQNASTSVAIAEERKQQLEAVIALAAAEEQEAEQILTVEKVDGLSSMVTINAAKLVGEGADQTLSITFTQTTTGFFPGTIEEQQAAGTSQPATSNTITGLNAARYSDGYAALSIVNASGTWRQFALWLDGTTLKYGQIANSPQGVITTDLTPVKGADKVAMLTINKAQIKKTLTVSGSEQQLDLEVAGTSSSKYVAYYLGTAEEAEAAGSTTDIPDNTTITGLPVDRFDGQEGSLALLLRGTKDTWKTVMMKIDGTTLTYSKPQVQPEPEPEPQPEPSIVTLTPEKPASGQTGSIMLKVDTAVLNATASATTLDIQFSTDVKAYYLGTAEDQAAAGTSIPMTDKKITGLDAAQFMGQYAPIAVQYTNSGNWVTVALKVDQTAKKLYFGSDALLPVDPTPGPTPTPEPTPAPDPEKADNTPSSSTGDTSVTLADGTYKPDSFSWSGGTGRLKGMSCDEVIIRGGNAYARLVINSSSYAYVMANGSTCANLTPGSGVSTFEIPIVLNENNTISGLTTAMSTSHWVNYTIYVGLAAAGKGGSAATSVTASDELDTEAPKIAGLTFESETKFENAQDIKIFNYDKGFKLVEVKISNIGSWKDGIESGTLTELLQDLRKAELEANENSDATAMNLAEAYLTGTVKYLIVPEGEEAPAGIDAKTVIVKQPVENLFVASADALKTISQLGMLDQVSTVLLTEKDLAGDDFADVRAAIADGKIQRVDPSDEIDYKSIVKEKCGLFIASPEMLTGETSDAAKTAKSTDTKATDAKAKQQAEKYLQMVERFDTLKVPFLLDVSSLEEKDNGQAEWVLLYGAIFNADEKAAQIYEQTKK